MSYWSNKPQSASHNSHLLNINFSTALSIFTHNPADLYALSKISAKYFFCTVTHITIYVFT